MNMVLSEASIVEASRLMRQSGETALAVLSEAEGQPCVIGVVTAGDIVTRVLAVGLDPSVLTVGDITTVPGVTVPY